ncbi:MAG: serine O-acetyltransferase [Gammaproteobacteria bacterium]|nr:serine O-acetyltransferase [Gammaproteobacteria bacterium]MXY57569.1 serine O-acetyltransferase [Gammaproteobacteria bacterium]MYF30234.1 serine O-acetyltransferase [Gammaproteobacteria bacterium]MYK44768.1 serine O-acetyltransferase [Gammaproteobacteria bacterium]
MRETIQKQRDDLLDRYRATGVLDVDAIWEVVRGEAASKANEEPILGSYFHATILNHTNFRSALSFRLASKLDNPMLPTMLIRDVIDEAMGDDANILESALTDMLATYDRDPACEDLSTPFLFLKGFHALQAHRIAHWLWHRDRHTLALFFQSQISVGLDVDIHPAARMGRGILVDHATGIVIGETAVVENDVSILHAVTLGGTGKETGDRHPKVRHGVLLGAGCKVIGNIEIGAGAKVGAGSVVLEDVPPHVTVAGVPAQVVGPTKDENPALGMDQTLR